MSKFQSKSDIYRKFQEKTGIQLTEEALPATAPEIQDELEDLYYLAQNRPRKAIPRLEQLMEQYPHIPSIKNYLHVSYALSNQRNKEKAIQERILQEHPGYIFAIFNKLMNISNKEEIEKYAHLLGEPRHIHTLTGDRVLHDSEFLNYQMVAIHYESLTGDVDSAVNRLETLIDIETPEKTLADSAKKIAIARVMNIGQKMSKMQEGRITVESFPKVQLELSEKPPILQHPELSLFYQKSIKSLNTSKLEQFLSLPKESLIADLEAILEDSIRRYQYFHNQKYQEDAFDFSVHALYFLGALKAEQSLEKVLNLLRMGKGFTEFWYADMVEEFFYPTLYRLGEQQLEKLKAFVLEDNLFTFDRMMVPLAVSQIALHQPQRRQEVIDWFKEVYTYLLDNADNKHLIDSDFISSSVGYVIDIRGKALIPLIKKLYEKKWIPDNIQGNLEKIIEQIEAPAHPYELQPLPQNIEEYYTTIYTDRRAESPLLSEADQQVFDKFFNREAEKLVTKYSIKLITTMKSGKNPFEVLNEDEYFEDEEDGNTRFLNENRYVPPTQPIVRDSPKVGRNDPCPCGSGKKYKKCCLRK